MDRRHYPDRQRGADVLGEFGNLSPLARPAARARRPRHEAISLDSVWNPRLVIANGAGEVQRSLPEVVDVAPAKRKEIYASLTAYQMQRASVNGKVFYVFKDEKEGVAYVGARVNTSATATWLLPNASDRIIKASNPPKPVKFTRSTAGGGLTKK